MKRKHDLLKEKSKTRDAVGQISSWCLLIALHQRFGVGADRMERIAGKAEKLQKKSPPSLTNTARLPVSRKCSAA
ncbi:MAG: hypothetical protein ACLRYE_11770 [Gemmiger formicilis]|uniref:hypothetical protein n=1 Tax=Gemmiger formicilis TaxID=745368 RepID=UPI0039A2F128